MTQPQHKFQKILSNFGHLWIFGQKTGFCSREVMHRVRPFRLGSPFQEKFSFLDFSCKNILTQKRSRNFTKFWASRRSKNKQKMTFYHLFDTQEAVLGDCNFGGVNGHQIPKFNLGWKLDIPSFPTSLRSPHWDTWKCLKSYSKCARPLENQRTTSWEIFTEIVPTAQQNTVLTRFDFLEWILILLDVNDVILWCFDTFYLF